MLTFVQLLESLKQSFESIGPSHPLRGTLESSMVVTDADADVGDTHVSGSSGTTTVADVSMSLDLNDRSETASAGRPMLEFGPRGPGVRGTSASAGSAGAGNRDNTPDAHPCPYSDIRLSNRASHGDADAAAVGSSMRPGWSEPFHPKAGVPGGFALPPGAVGAAAAIFGEWPGGGAAGPALIPREAVHREESDAAVHTWLANNLPPAPPQQVPGVETGKGRGPFLLDSGSPAMSTWRPSVPKSSLPRPSTATDAWQGSSGPASSSAWEQTPTPWSASSSRSWQGWSSSEWRDDATRRQRPARPERGTAPYPKGKGKKGKKGHDPAS